VGPTGVGKTESVKSKIRALGGNPEFHLIRIDCGEFQDAAKISALIGGSAMYVGYGDKPRLHKDELAKRTLKMTTPKGQSIDVNFLMIDEIEKCNEKIFDLLLGILDNGKATMGDNSVTYFRNTFIYATSNLGADGVEALVRAKREKNATINSELMTPEQSDLTGRYDKSLREQIRLAYIRAMDAKFKPEFKNRWQVIIQFLHLSRVEFAGILEKNLAFLQKRIFESGEVKVGVLFSEDAKELLIDRGTDVLNGARELERTLELEITNRLARLAASQQFVDGDVLLIDAKGDTPETRGFTFRVVAKGLTQPQLLQFADSAYPTFRMTKVEFDKKPDHENQEAGQKAPTIIEELGKNPEAMRELWLDYNKGPVKNTKPPQNDSGLISQATRFYKIDGKLVRMNSIGATFTLQEVIEIPTVLKEFFPIDQIEVISKDIVVKYLKASKK
jgi:hypothetical protein